MRLSTETVPVNADATTPGSRRPMRRRFRSSPFVRRDRWVCAVAGVVLAVPLAGAGLAHAPGASGPVRQAAAAPAADSAPYTCNVHPGPFDRCDRVYASPGETVSVRVNESGTVTQGDFQGVNRSTGEVLGTVRDVTPSSGAAVIWRNDTDATVVVDLLATSADSGSIHGLMVAEG